MKPSSVSDALNAAIETQGMTQVDVAKRMGISAPSLNRLLKSDRNLTLRSLNRIAEALDLRVEIHLATPEEASK